MQEAARIARADVKKAKTPPSVKAKKENGESAPVYWDKSPEKRVAPGWRKLKEQMESSLLVFKIAPQGTLKLEWASLPEGVQKAFHEVFRTVSGKGDTPAPEGEGACFVFGYSDDSIHLSAVCTSMNGKTAFFFKEEKLASA